MDEIPDSFFEALEDVKQGRIVDMEYALHNPPTSTCCPTSGTTLEAKFYAFQTDNEENPDTPWKEN